MLRCLTLSLVVVLAGGAALPAQEPLAKNRIVSLDLFKNGLAIVKREVKLPNGGSYRLDAMPEAVHGTFWIQSTGKVDAALRMREVEEPADRLGEGGLTEIFQGKKVTVFFNGAKMPPATGTVPKVAVDKAAVPDRHGRIPGERFFVLKTAKGFMYINPTEVAAVETEEAGEKTTRKKPVLILTADKGEKEQTVSITYLAQGLAWAPSYLLDVSDPKTMVLEMAAVLRNEMEDFSEADVRLISGYPSIEFAQVGSPLQAQATWARFFQELASRGSGGRSEHAILSQQIVSNTERAPTARGFPLDAKPEGEGVDLHFQPVGARSLIKGEALSLTVGKSPTSYERIVEWVVGRGHGSLGLRATGPEDIWDVLLFRNPFAYPLTTAPAMMVEKGRFNGQRTCYWTNAGEETRVKVTRSLSLRTASTEDMDPTRQPERVAVGRRDFTRIHLKGELKINNHRKEKVKVHVLYPIHGQVVPDAEGEPRITPRPGSLTDVNPTNDVLWIVTLNPGEEKKLGYRYSTLVDR